jgi:hypothetical protein
MNRRLAPLLQFLLASVVATAVGTMYFNGGIVKSAQATLSSVATTNSQTINSASWKAVLGADSLATATSPFNVTQASSYEDISTTSASSPIYSGTTKCQLSSGTSKIYLTAINSGIAIGMQVNNQAGSGVTIIYGTVTSISTIAGDLTPCSGSKMRITLTQNSPVSIATGANLDFQVPNPAPLYTGTTCRTTTLGNTNIYLSSYATQISAGMIVSRISNGTVTTYGVVLAAVQGEFPSCSGGNDMWITLATGSITSISSGIALRFQMPDVPVTTVTGHKFYKVISLNNTGTHSISAATFTHTQTAATLESCSTTYVLNTCQAIATPITPGTSHTLSLPVGGHINIKVSLTANDLVTTLADTVSVAVSNLQIGTPIVSNS